MTFFSLTAALLKWLSACRLYCTRIALPSTRLAAVADRLLKAIEAWTTIPTATKATIAAGTAILAMMGRFWNLAVILVLTCNEDVSWRINTAIPNVMLGATAINATKQAATGLGFSLPISGRLRDETYRSPARRRP